MGALAYVGAATLLLVISFCSMPTGVDSQFNLLGDFNHACSYHAHNYTWLCLSQRLHVNSSLQNLVKINYTDFIKTGNEVIILKMADHHGYMPQGTFVGFENRNNSGTNTHAPTGSPYANPIPDPALIFECDWGYQGFVGVENNTFQGMGFMRHLSFYECDFWIYPDGSFSHFDLLYTLTISGGNLNNLVPDTFMGMNVQPQPGVPGSGAVYISAKVPPPNYWFPVFFFDHLANMTSLTLKGNYMRRIFSSMLWRLPNLEYLELSGQNLFFIPTSLFSRSDALSYVKLHDYAWFCSCSNEWWVWYLNERGIPWEADQICAFPSSQKGKTLGRFGDEVCRPNPTLDITAKILECAFSLLLMVLAALVWLNVIPLWNKVLVKAIINEWADIPFDAVAKDPEDEGPESFSLDVRAKNKRDKAAMEGKVRRDLELSRQQDILVMEVLSKENDSNI